MTVRHFEAGASFRSAQQSVTWDNVLTGLCSRVLLDEFL